MMHATNSRPWPKWCRDLRGIGTLLLAVTACDRADLEAPVAGGAGIALTLAFPAALDASTGPLSAYRKTDRVWLRVHDGVRTRAQSDVTFGSGADEARVPIQVRLRAPSETLELEVEIRRGSDAVFSARAPVALTTGRTTPVEAMLDPVVAGVLGPANIRMSAWGDSLRLEGAVLFITGDTIHQDVGWSSLDAGIASIDTAGVLVARADGTAKIVLQAAGHTDTVTVDVFADVESIVVSPANSTLPLGSTRQFMAVLRDRRGNTITGRPIVWTTSAASIISIDANGLARAVGVGDARVAATAAKATADVAASAVPVGPGVEALTAIVDGLRATLQATVFPNGAPTQAWFQWNAPAAPAPPSLTASQSVGSGLDAMPLLATLQNLRPNTRYVVRAAAGNDFGSTESDSISFMTGSIAPIAITIGASGVSQTDAMLMGSVNPNGAPTDVWFQWGTSPTLATYTETAAQSVNGFLPLTILAGIALDGTPQTVWFRVLARNSAGAAMGEILSFTTVPPITPDPPIAVTDSASAMGPHAATLHGTVTPGNAATSAWFEWSTDTGFTTFTATPAQAVGAGATPVTFSAGITGLVIEEPIWIRAAASNVRGTSRGAILRIR